LQIFGDFLGFNPHLHILVSDGCFCQNGIFFASPININTKELEPLFRHKLLSILKKKRLIIEKTIELISS